MGSLAAIPLIWGMSYLSSGSYVVLTIAAFLGGIKICEVATRDLGVHDHGGIVWDEIVGMMIAFVFVPLNPTSLIIGFLLFRFFDILKPWPISELDRNVHGGLGIMVDDLLAGLFSALLLGFQTGLITVIIQSLCHGVFQCESF